MRCPFCAHLEDKVVDSRLSKDGDAIRRRRECLQCERRYTTYEHIEDVLPLVVKKDGRREPFDRLKIFHGLQKACEKRPVSTATLDATTDEIERDLQDLPDREVSSSWIGEKIMEKLRSLDQVAYVRFASVYREFKDINEFMNELAGILKKTEAEKKK
ncbi:MAG: transcriptional regulator NrdR [Nitrospirota bacterium]|nr:transcriptional regulator NrdR [Nitrospirota bacterium]